MLDFSKLGDNVKCPLQDLTESQDRQDSKRRRGTTRDNKRQPGTTREHRDKETYRKYTHNCWINVDMCMFFDLHDARKKTNVFKLSVVFRCKGWRGKHAKHGNRSYDTYTSRVLGHNTD
jgi:hypothetical protein